MDADRGQEFHRALLEEALGQRRWDVLNQVAPDHRLHQNAIGGLEDTGPRALRAVVLVVQSALKIEAVQITDQLADGERVVTRFVLGGVHAGAQGIFLPTHREVTIPALIETRFAGDLAAETWLELDTLGVLRAMGVARAELIVMQLES